MKKLLIASLLFFSFGMGVDFITPVLHQWGADNSQVGHFIVGKSITDIAEDNFSMEPLHSLLLVYVLAEAKEGIDVMTGSFRDPEDVKWTCYGWVLKRFLTWKVAF